MSQQKATLPAIQPFAKRRQVLPSLKLKRYQLGSKEALILLTTCIALAQTLLHLVAINAYGFHEDELLYMTLGDHLAWGYIETGPLIAVIGDLSKWLFGDSLIAIRILPAICAGAIVHLTGILTIRLGGKQLAVIMACTAVAFSPAFLASGALFIPQVFDELFWLLTVYLVVCWIQKPNDTYLYELGVVVGLGILLKYTLLLYVAGILLGIAYTPSLRVLFKKKSFYFSMLIAFFIVLPHLIWQIDNNFPAFAHYRELKETQLNYMYRLDFLTQQLLVNGPAVLLWLVGIIYLFYSKKLKAYRFFGVSFLIVMAVLALLKGKPYYGFGAFPPLFVIGALCLENWLTIKNLSIKIALLSFLIIPNFMLSFISLPILQIENAAKVFAWARQHLGITFTVKWEDQKIHKINQNYADMIGWEELAQKTSALYMTLSPNEQKKTIIYTESYGIASAVSYYAKYYPLPKVVSLNGSFATWAPKNVDDKLIISFARSKPGRRLNPNILEMQHFVVNPFSRLYGMQIEISKMAVKTEFERLKSLSAEKLN
ncbi:hypothetical protein ABIB40_002587 [Pedobacter sp. UYP30]|uniref:ArnT family glycosyltransferase n=1 Tax=Pedobacter sp. UYP30 TaxID=1756400 RepID=UPI003396FADE